MPKCGMAPKGLLGGAEGAWGGAAGAREPWWYFQAFPQNIIFEIV